MEQQCGVQTLNGKEYRCFFELALHVIGGKWKPVILYHLSRHSAMRFGELKRSLPDVTQRMLTKQLRELEADQIVTRTVFRQVPPKVEYALTELGRELIPVFDQMRSWGIMYEKAVRVPRDQTSDAKEDSD